MGIQTVVQEGVKIMDMFADTESEQYQAFKSMLTLWNPESSKWAVHASKGYKKALNVRAPRYVKSCNTCNRIYQMVSQIFCNYKSTNFSRNCSEVPNKTECYISYSFLFFPTYLHGLIRTYMFIYFWKKFPPTLFLHNKLSL